VLTFGIVIPNYNQSHFLPSALESLKYQSSPFQVAVMDGGSTDNFKEVIREYSDIITHLNSAPDEGQAGAIREGEEIISGDIVAWLNADDYYFPETLEKVASCFEKDPELDLVYGDAIHVNSEGFFLSYFPPIQDFNAKELTENCFICQPACFVRRSAYERVGGLNPSLRYTMDWDLWCRLSASGARFRYLPEPLAAVRYYQGTKTLSGDKERFREIYRIEKKYGTRRLRTSFLGAYYYGLSFEKKRDFRKNIVFVLLSILRTVKSKIDRAFREQGTQDSLIYGFQRWKPIVEGACQIHVPWYDRRKWRRLCLKVRPNRGQYHISLNGKPCEKMFQENDYLVIEVPELHSPYRRIDIEHVNRKRWKLLQFTCDLDDPY
jgi:glycosyltransferase involved in cell wall biosynthesis